MTQTIISATQKAPTNPLSFGEAQNYCGLRIVSIPPAGTEGLVTLQYCNFRTNALETFEGPLKYDRDNRPYCTIPIFSEHLGRTVEKDVYLK